MSQISAEVRIRPGPKNVLDVSKNRITVGQKIYSFSRVHLTESQAEFFSSSILPFLESGPGPCTVLAYGQTGSGKTYTMGLGQTALSAIPPQEDGVIQRTIAWAINSGYSPSCSFIEIYNEEVYDLLADRTPLCLRQSTDGISIVGISEHSVSSYEDGLSLLRTGNHCRTTKATKMNISSSRSHAVFIMETPSSRLSFIDLAGSERMKRTQCFGSTAKEAISINAGLLALGNVISALYMGRTHVPFRDSKLTRILQSCLVGRVLLIACVSGRVEDAFETSNTLKYASRAATILLKEKVEESKDGREILQLRKEISALKEENRRLRAAAVQSGMKDEKIRGHPLVLELLRRLRVYEGEETIKGDKAISETNTKEAKAISEAIIKEDKGISIKETGAVLKREEFTTKSIKESSPSVPFNRNPLPNKTPPLNNENSNNLIKGKKRSKIVSFNLEQKPKNPLFTPLKENNSLSFSLVYSIPDQSPLSFITYKGRIVFNTSDSKINIYNSKESDCSYEGDCDYEGDCNKESDSGYEGDCNKESVYQTALDCTQPTLSPYNNTLPSIETLYADDSIKCIASEENNLFFSSRSLLKVLSFDSKRPFPVYAHKTEITALNIQGNIIFTGHEDGTLSVLDLRSNGLIYSGRVHSGTIFDIGIEREGIYTCSRDHTVKYSASVGDIPLPGDFVELRPPHYDSVGKLIFHKGRCISLGRDGALKVWEGGRPFKTVAFAHGTWIKSGCKGERRFYTGGKGGDLKCWDFSGGSVQCIGKEETGSGINCMIEKGENLIVGTQGRSIDCYLIKG